MANITLLGASYTDVPAVDLPQTGGGTVRFYEAPTSTDFIITLSWNTQTSRWEPDYTFTEIQTAVSAGKTVLIVTDDVTCWARGSYDATYDPYLEYSVIEQGYTPSGSLISGYIQRDYLLDATGIGDFGASPLGSRNSINPITITANGTYNAEFIGDLGYNTVTVNVSSGTPTLQAKTASPTTSQQTITADSGYDGLSQVTISAMPSGTAGTPTATKGTVSNHSISVTPSVTNTTGYITGGTETGTAVSVSASELVSGSETKTANGTYDVTNLAELVVNVSGGSGSSNFVQGTFTAQSSAGVQSISVPYTGSGYPIAIMVVVSGGAYNSANSEWYNSTQRYAVGLWTCTKSVFTSAPTYTTSGTQNQGVVAAIYKNSTSSATSYNRASGMSTNIYSSSDASNSSPTCVRYKSGNILSVYVNTSSYGLMPGLDYDYFIVYSS